MKMRYLAVPVILSAFAAIIYHHTLLYPYVFDGPLIILLDSRTISGPSPPVEFVFAVDALGVQALACYTKL